MLLHGKKVSCSWRTHDMHQPISYSCFFLWCMLVILPPSQNDRSTCYHFSNCSNLLDMTPAAGQDTSKHNISSNPVLFSMHIMFGLLQNLLYKSYYWWANKQVEAKSRRVSGKCHCVMLYAGMRTVKFWFRLDLAVCHALLLRPSSSQCSRISYH